MNLHNLYKKQVEAWKERLAEMEHREGCFDENGQPKQNLLSSRHKDTIELIEAMGKMLDTIDQDDHGHEENVIRARVKSDLLIRLEEQLKLIKKEQ